MNTPIMSLLAMASVAVGVQSASAASVASFCERAEKDERLTVAFLGGSLSWGANASDPNRTSWRTLIGRRLEERYPDALRATFRGEVLLLYGESAEWSPKCEVFVDGKRVAERDTAAFGRMFAPTAYLVWQVGAGFDADAEHALEIRPVFADGEPQEFRLGSICVAGRDAAWVRKN